MLLQSELLSQKSMVDRDCHLQKVWALDSFARAILLCHLRVTKKLEEEKEFAEKQAVYGHITNVLCDLGCVGKDSVPLG